VTVTRSDCIHRGLQLERQLRRWFKSDAKGAKDLHDDDGCFVQYFIFA